MWGENLFAIGICLLVSGCFLIVVNLYAGDRAEQGYRYGYIAGYSEAKANLPSRHKYEEKK